MLVIKLHSGLYFCGEVEEDAIYSYNKFIANKFEDEKELAKVIDRHKIEGYSVSTVKG